MRGIWTANKSDTEYFIDSLVTRNEHVRFLNFTFSYGVITLDPQNPSALENVAADNEALPYETV